MRESNSREVGITREEVEDPDKEIAFPESVRGFFRGELGQPTGGFPKALQKKVLQGEEPMTKRPGAYLEPADLGALRSAAEKKVSRPISDEEFNSYLMYPQVFADYAKHRKEFGPVHVLPTPVYHYGMKPGDEITVALEAGKTLEIRCQAVGDTDEEGNVKVFFDLNGQPRRVKVADRKIAETIEKRPRAEEGNPNHVPAPMLGMIASLAVSEGQKVTAGDLLLTIEAMKMETAIRAERDGTIGRIVAGASSKVDAKDLLIKFAA